MALSLEAEEPKTQLNTFCQKHLRVPITKNDIVYTTALYGTVYQSTVKLNCMGGVEFAGETAPNQKEAEKNAARMAVSNYAAEIAALGGLGPGKTGGKKRKASALGEEGATPGESANAAATPEVMSSKADLNTICMKITRRALTKEEIVFQTVQTVSGYQCTVSLPCLPNEWSTMAWAGEVADTKKVAEQFAAKYALDAIKVDPQLSALANAPNAKSQKTGKGKGGSKGGDWSKGGGGDWSKGGGGDWWGGGKAGKGKGFGKGKQDRGIRQRLTPSPVFGTVLEWLGNYGFIQLNEKIDHPHSQRGNGKVFIGKNDWKDVTKTPTPGMTVICQVYADNLNLGAEEVYGL